MNFMIMHRLYVCMYEVYITMQIESADLESAPTADGASVGLQTAVQEDHDEKIWKQSRYYTCA